MRQIPRHRMLAWQELVYVRDPYRSSCVGQILTEDDKQILLAFIITAALALGFSSFIVFSEIRGKKSRNISRKILGGLSDQMIVEGLAIQIVGLARVRTMIPYHFFIIWMLALLSTATNFATLMALVQDFKRDWVLRWLRQIAMFVNLALTIVYGVFVLQTNMNNLAPTLPIYCVWEPDHATADTGRSNSAVSLAGTIAVIAVSSIIFVLGTWYLHMPKQVWGRVVRVISLLLLMGIAIGAAARVMLISQAFGSPSVALSEEGEKQWSFGQLLTMLLLILPFISALEIYRGMLTTSAPSPSMSANTFLGEMAVPRANPCADSDQIPLTANEEEYKTGVEEGSRGFRLGRRK